MPKIEPGNCTIGFCGQQITVNYFGPEAEILVDFLFTDLFDKTGGEIRGVYDLIIVGDKPMMSLWEGEKRFYFGECAYTLSCILVNKVIHQCIVQNNEGYVVNAGAVDYNGKGILFPGRSGSGKNALVAWLAAKGCHYLTDELILISKKTGLIHPFTRPISIKTDSAQTLSSFLDIDPKKVLTGERGFMMPHRLVNECFFPDTPPLSVIIFPEYRAGESTKIVQLSCGAGFSKLISCYVNARNHSAHGIGDLADMVRKTEMYQLIYSGFDDLAPALSDLFPGVLQ